MVFNTVIETERLLLRKLSLSDAADMFEYTSKSEVATHLSWAAHTDISQVEAFISGVLEKYNSIQTEYTFGIELKSHKKLIGALKITNISFYNKRGEFTSILNPAFQGKGYMGEAWQGLLNFSFSGPSKKPSAITRHRLLLMDLRNIGFLKISFAPVY